MKMFFFAFMKFGDLRLDFRFGELGFAIWSKELNRFVYRKFWNLACRFDLEFASRCRISRCAVCLEDDYSCHRCRSNWQHSTAAVEIFVFVYAFIYADELITPPPLPPPDHYQTLVHVWVAVCGRPKFSSIPADDGRAGGWCQNSVRLSARSVCRHDCGWSGMERVWSGSWLECRWDLWPAAAELRRARHCLVLEKVADAWLIKPISVARRLQGADVTAPFGRRVSV